MLSHVAAVQQLRLARSVCLDHASTLLRAFSHQLLASWQCTHALMLTHFSKQSPWETYCGECLLLVAWLMLTFQYVVGHLSLHPYMLSPYMTFTGLTFPWTLSPSAFGATSFVMFSVFVEQHHITGMVSIRSLNIKFSLLVSESAMLIPVVHYFVKIYYIIQSRHEKFSWKCTKNPKWVCLLRFIYIFSLHINSHTHKLTK